MAHTAHLEVSLNQSGDREGIYSPQFLNPLFRNRNVALILQSMPHTCRHFQDQSPKFPFPPISFKILVTPFWVISLKMEFVFSPFSSYFWIISKERWKSFYTAIFTTKVITSSLLIHLFGYSFQFSTFYWQNQAYLFSFFILFPTSHLLWTWPQNILPIRFSFCYIANIWPIGNILWALTYFCCLDQLCPI